MTDLEAVLTEYFGGEAKIDIAKRMLRRGTAIEVVAEDTGLDIIKISQLLDEMNFLP